MFDRNAIPWWRSQIPTAALLFVMVVIAIWALAGNIGAAQDISLMTTGKGILLVVIGFLLVSWAV